MGRNLKGRRWKLQLLGYQHHRNNISENQRRQEVEHLLAHGNPIAEYDWLNCQHRHSPLKCMMHSQHPILIHPALVSPVSVAAHKGSKSSLAMSNTYSDSSSLKIWELDLNDLQFKLHIWKNYYRSPSEHSEWLIQ